jgi:flagellar hook-basal body complex protein FliE
MNPIGNIPAAAPLPGPALGRTEAARDGPTFKDFLLQSIQEVNSMQQAADRAVEALSTGQEVSPAEVLTAVQKADVAFRLMMQIRNKVVQAYQEVQNIRV